MLNQPTVICLMGPTAAGKTSLALELVARLPCAIVSVDSAMIYRGMDIGTAKPSAEEQARAPHRLIDICDPAERYSAGQFRRDALREIQQIVRQGKIPLLVGGTMLYFRSLLHGLAELPTANFEVRERLTLDAAKLGWPALHQRLQVIDPVAAKRINKNDSQRIQRALEVYETTGKPLTEWFEQNGERSFPYPVISIGLMPAQRSVLHAHIKERFQQMLKQGLIEEVNTLYQRGDLHLDLPSIRTVGYRQVWNYLMGVIDKTVMQEQAITATCQLAKRQLTWLRSWPNLVQMDTEDKQRLDAVLTTISKAYKK